MLVAYVSINLVFSLVAFYGPEEVVTLTNPGSGHMIKHITFGFLSGIFTFNLPLATLFTGLSVLLDVDHTLAGLGFHVIGRPSHSLVFASVSSLALGYLFKNPRFNSQLALGNFGAFLAHIAVDNPGVPLFVPLTFDKFGIEGGSGLFVWESLAILASFLGYVTHEKSGMSTKS